MSIDICGIFRHAIGSGNNGASGFRISANTSHNFSLMANLLKMFAENQLKNHENELQNFIRQIQIVDMVIEMLEDYQYGDVATLIENFMNPSSQNS